MSGGTGTQELYAAIEESARLVGAPFSSENVRPVLTAYGEALTTGAIIFSIGGRQAGELEYTVQVSDQIADPHAYAVAHGFVEATEHPVGTLLSDIRANVRVSEIFIDCGVVGGFKKVYAQFLQDFQKVSSLAALPSAPRALSDNADFFDRHGLTDVALVGIDYQRRTMNTYFQLPAGVAGNLAPEAITAMLRDIGLPKPDERMLQYATGSYRIYTTLSWDSSDIHRISFAPRPRRGMDLDALPARLDPATERFVKNAPRTYDGDLINASAVKWTPTGEHLDLAAYHQAPPQLLKLLDGTP